MLERRDAHPTVGGLRLHVVDWGPASAPPVVMMHGIRGYAQTFAGLAAALSPGRRVVAFDQRGRGDSDWDPHGRYDTETYVQDLVGVLDALDLGVVDLLGHSMGGINAIVFAARHPSRVGRLVIEDAGPGAFEASVGATRIRRELSTTPARFADWAAAEDFMRALRPTVSDAARHQRLVNMLKPDGDGFTWRYDHAGITAARLRPDPARVVDLWPCVAALACPTLLLRGDRSDYLSAATAAEMVARNRRIEWHDVADAGHYVHDDQPDAVARRVVAFLADPAATR